MACLLIFSRLWGKLWGMIPESAMPRTKEDFRIAVDAKDDGELAAEASKDLDRLVYFRHRSFHATASA
jgi:hypothetical protein